MEGSKLIPSRADGGVEAGPAVGLDLVEVGVTPPPVTPSVPTKR